MTLPLSKTATISGTNANGNTVELGIPAKSQKATTSNNINSFQRPKPDGGAPETRALNLNRIEIQNQLTASVTDEFVDANHDGNGDRPNLSNKEEWLNELWLLYISVNILDLKITNSKTKANVAEFSGFMHNLDWTEQAQQENSVYDVTIKFVDEVKMNG